MREKIKFKESQTAKRGARRGRRARQGTDENKDLEKGIGSRAESVTETEYRDILKNRNRRRY